MKEKLPAKFDEVLITWISKGSFALETVFGTCAVTCVSLFLVTVGEEISVPFTSINFTFTARFFNQIFKSIS